MLGMLFKLVYSALLLGIVGVAGRELWTVWLDRRIYIGAFDVVSDSGKDDSLSQTFPQRIVAAQTILSQQIVDYQSRRKNETSSDPTYTIPGMPTLNLPPEALAGVDITVQNINLRQILTALRRSFLAPNEITGRVAEQTGSILAAVDWPQAPRPANGGSAPTKFLAPNRASAQEVAAYIACSISWARAASGDAKFAEFSRSQFCDFAAALADFYASEDSASTTEGLSETSVRRVRKDAATLRSHYEEVHVFPGIYRLRADLLDLLPEKTRTQDELVEAQEARVRYAMLSSELQALPEEEKRIAALALARPAILLDNNGKPKDPPENWAGLLKRHTDKISAAARSTGLITSSSEILPALGTGFIVAPGLMMTARHVADLALRPPNAEPTSSAKPSKLCLGSSSANCVASLELEDILYPKEKEESQIALVEIRGHDPDLYPPLSLAIPSPTPNEVVGSYVYVIGYPFYDPRNPADFVKRLLGEAYGQRRLMPGRILAFGRRVAAGSDQFTTDISTTGGTGGGPLIDLKTGKVIGVSYGGEWKGDRGKFAYPAPIPSGVLEIINQRTRLAQDAQGSPTAPAKPPGN